MLKLNIVVVFMLTMCTMLVVATSTIDGTTSSDTDGEIAAFEPGKPVVSKVVGFSSQYSTTR